MFFKHLGKKRGPVIHVNQGNPAQQWISERLQEGHNIDEISSYLKAYGYDADNVTALLSPYQQSTSQSSPISQDATSGADFERLSPTNAKEFFTRLYLLVRYPSFFFTHLYSTNAFMGLRMFSFSLLVSLTIGLLFWFFYYYSNLFLIIPSSIAPLFSISLTAKTFIMFFLILVVFHPLYYLILHKHSAGLTYKQFMTGFFFSLTPFIMLSSIPILNLVAVLISLHLAEIAFRYYFNADSRTIFDLSAIYTIGLAVIALGMTILFAMSNQPFQDSCVLYPEGKCMVQRQSWNAVSIVGIDTSQVTVFDSNNEPICSGESTNIQCRRLLTAGGYYFATENTAGAFTLT